MTGATQGRLRAAAELWSRNFSSGDELHTMDHSKKSHARQDAEIAVSFRRRDGSAVPVSELLKYVK
ncbi:MULTISPECIES: hypothetical protein [Streptomyces]|nr:hypothetical protein [Streptomyces rubrolavendulae]